VTNKDINIIKKVRELVLTTVWLGIQGTLSTNSNVKVASTIKNIYFRTKKVMFLNILKNMADPIAIINYILN
jgi:hypothetical protein